MSEGHFEAKVERRSENAKGIFITLLINPADHDEALSQVRVGSALQIGWAEIVDTSVQKIEVEPLTTAEDVKGILRDDWKAPPKPKTAFRDMSLPAQAGMRCGDGDFLNFLVEFSRTPTAVRFAWTDAASFVRNYCGVASRSELSGNREAANKWRKLDSDFESWLLTQRYAPVMR